jgi:uncharacterized membrane protein YoaK (UPF0700 family)
MTESNLSWNATLALVLATVAGWIDAVGYLVLHGLFTAHMTGNTSKLGIALGHGGLWEALPLAVVPVLFMAGVGAGTLLADAGRRPAALALQAALVVAFMGYGSASLRNGVAPDHGLAGFYVPAGLATTALGIQTAALTHIQGSTVRTSYISGVLTNLAQAAARRLREPGGGGDAPARLLAGVCAAYLIGATAAAYGRSIAGIWCLAPAVAALVTAAAVDGRRARRSDPRP